MWPYLNRIARFEFRVNKLGFFVFSFTSCFPRYPPETFCVAFGVQLRKSPSLFMFFHNEWKINTCLIWGIKKWPLLPMASVVTTWHCQIAVRTCNPRGMNDSNIMNGRVGLNTSACFIGVRIGTCVYLPNKWIRLPIHSARLHRHNLVSAEWCHLKWTCSWLNGV